MFHVVLGAEKEARSVTGFLKEEEEGESGATAAKTHRIDKFA